MVNLPEEFLTELRALLSQDELEGYVACYEQPVQSGLRVNTLKKSVADFQEHAPFCLTQIPWTRNGFFFDEQDNPTHHPWYAAGAYYVQEPSAMIPAQLLPVEPGDVVLDLCAAPGGKATEIAARLQGTGFLLANDISNSRAKALLRNLERFGVANMAVCSESSAKLSQYFPGTFDKILVDAPCSGEGMFHKEPSMVQDWLQRGPVYYAEIQHQILQDAATMLKPGGMLLYSTCTFSTAEDEGAVAWLLEQYPDFTVVPVPRYDGFAPGQAPCAEAVRVWPQRMQGEGHFACLLQKAGSVEPESVNQTLNADVFSSACLAATEEVAKFLQLLQQPRCLCVPGSWKTIRDQVVYIPDAAVLNQSVRYLRTGLLVGTLKKGRFEPAQQLALALRVGECTNVFSLAAGDARTKSYLRGETVELAPEEAAQLESGWVLVCVDNLPLGWAKAQNGTLKNKLDSGWRTA